MIFLLCVLGLLHSEEELIHTIEYDFIEINLVYNKDVEPKVSRFDQIICWNEEKEYPCQIYQLDDDSFKIVHGSKLVVHDWKQFNPNQYCFQKNPITKKYEMVFFDMGSKKLFKVISRIKPEISHTYNDVEVDSRNLVPAYKKIKMSHVFMMVSKYKNEEVKSNAP